MNLALLLAAFRAATTDDARNAAFAGVGYADRHRLSGEVTARIQELYANQNRTADESAEMADLVPIAERLDQMVQQDADTNARAQAIANRQTPANPSPATQAVAVRSNPNIPTGPEAQVLRAAWREQTDRANRIFGNDRAITRAIVSDLEAYGLRDSQVDRLASPEYADEFITWMRSCAHNPHGVQGRALNEITQDGGAVFVPADFLAEIIQRRAAQRRVAGMVRRIQTSRDKISIPKHMGGSSTQQSDLGVQWVGAEGTVTEDTGLQENAMVTIQVHRGGFYVVADRALLEDSAFDVESWIIEMITDTYEAAIDNIIINGSGNGRPFGLVTRTGTTTAADNLITAVNIGDPVDPTGLMNIIGNLDAQYANNAQWLTRRSTYFSQIASLRDGVGGFLFAVNNTTTGGTQGRIESQLLGYPVNHSDHMAAATAGAKIAYFGDFRAGYGLVERVALQIEPLIDPAIQKKDQRAWYVRFRVGGDVLADWSLRCGLNTDV